MCVQCIQSRAITHNYVHWVLQPSWEMQNNCIANAIISKNLDKCARYPFDGVSNGGGHLLDDSHLKPLFRMLYVLCGMQMYCEPSKQLFTHYVINDIMIEA